jgi:hypothetical protein
VAEFEFVGNSDTEDSFVADDDDDDDDDDDANVDF